jgi:hypothetical protein
MLMAERHFTRLFTLRTTLTHPDGRGPHGSLSIGGQPMTRTSPAIRIAGKHQIPCPLDTAFLSE